MSEDEVITSPITPPDEDLLKKQFEIFQIKEGEQDNIIVRQNKAFLQKTIKELKRNNLLYSGTMKSDFKILEYYKGVNQTVVYKVKSKHQAPSPSPSSSPDSAITMQLENLMQSESNMLKAIKRVKLNISERHKRYRDIMTLTSLKNKNHLKIEKVFFEYEKNNHQYFVNILVPFVKYDFLSWLNNDENGRNYTQFDIPKCKRNFFEIRNVLKQILHGLEYLHKRNILHLNFRFSNILVDENDTVLISDVGFHAISSTSLSPTQTKPSSNSSTASSAQNFSAPEVLLYFSQKQQNEYLLGDNTAATNPNPLNFISNNIIGKVTPSDSTKLYLPSAKADVFSFGILLYRLFVDEKDELDERSIAEEHVCDRIRKLFFSGDETPDMDVVADICSIIRLCLSENPRNRPTVTQLLTEFKFLRDKNQRKYSLFNDPMGLSTYWDNYLKQAEKQVFEEYEKESSTNLEACFMVAQILEDGQVTQPPKLENSAKQYLLAAESPEATNNLGVLFYNGYGVKQNYSKALTCFEKASAMGLAIANNNLGVLYENGFGCTQSYKLAILYYKRAAEKGCSEAVKNILQIDGFNETNIPDNIEKIINFYFEEVGIDANSNFFEDRECPHPIALKNMALFHKIGAGVPQNYELSLKYFELSADYGNIDAIFYLGQAHEFGLGCPVNLELARTCYELAATAEDDEILDQMEGRHEALFALGRLFENGKGVPKNIERAIFYHKKSIEKGNTKAKIELERLNKESCILM